MQVDKVLQKSVFYNAVDIALDFVIVTAPARTASTEIDKHHKAVAERTQSCSAASPRKM